MDPKLFITNIRITIHFVKNPINCGSPLLASLILQPWRWKQYTLPKSSSPSTKLYCITIHKILVFTCLVSRISDLAQFCSSRGSLFRRQALPAGLGQAIVRRRPGLVSAPLLLNVAFLPPAVPGCISLVTLTMQRLFCSWDAPQRFLQEVESDIAELCPFVCRHLFVSLYFSDFPSFLISSLTELLATRRAQPRRLAMLLIPVQHRGRQQPSPTAVWVVSVCKWRFTLWCSGSWHRVV
jgi:hypothetical protein